MKKTLTITLGLCLIFLPLCGAGQGDRPLSDEERDALDQALAS